MSSLHDFIYFHLIRLHVRYDTYKLSCHKCDSVAKLDNILLSMQLYVPSVCKKVKEGKSIRPKLSKQTRKLLYVTRFMREQGFNHDVNDLLQTD